MKLRYFESSDLYTPPVSQADSDGIKAVLDRVFATLERSKDDPALRDFIADSMDFDGVARAVEAAGLDGETYTRKVVENATGFARSSTQILPTPDDIQGYLMRRGYLSTVFQKSSPAVRDQNAKGIFSMIGAQPDTRTLTRDDQSDAYKRQQEIFTRLLRARCRYWFESLDDPFSSIQESLVSTIDNLLAEVGEPRDRINVFSIAFEFLKTMDARISPARLFVAYITRWNDRIEDTKIIYMKTVGDNESIEMLEPLKPKEKLLFISTKIAMDGPQPFHDALLDRLFEIKDSSPMIERFFDREGLIGDLFYDSSKHRYAVYQLDRKHGINEIDRNFREGREPLPGVDEERPVVAEIQATLDRQFPKSSFIKDRVLNHVEESIRTSRAESRRLDASRLNRDNWHETQELVAIDVPDFINSRMKSSFDRLQLLEYFIGTREEPPELTTRELSEERARLNVAMIADLRQRFVNSPPSPGPWPSSPCSTGTPESSRRRPPPWPSTGSSWANTTTSPSSGGSSRLTWKPPPRRSRRSSTRTSWLPSSTPPGARPGIPQDRPRSHGPLRHQGRAVPPHQRAVGAGACPGTRGLPRRRAAAEPIEGHKGS